MALILVVEDDRRTASILERYLRSAGYDVALAADGTAGLERFARERPDLIVLDVMLPGIDGFSVCRRIRESGDTPVLLLTARIDESDRLRGLLDGADDYVTKPFSPREVVARVGAILRRAGAPDRRSPMQRAFGRLQLDPLACDASVDGTALELTRTEYRLLEALSTSPGTPWSRNRLIERVFGWDYDGTERTIDTHVTNLRKKLSRFGDGAPRIGTAFGKGYRLERG